jgi:hypothetical protein
VRRASHASTRSWFPTSTLVYCPVRLPRPFTEPFKPAIMSALPHLRRMRIIALPLASKTKTRDALTYYQFVTRAPQTTQDPSLLTRATNKAASTWEGFGKAEGGWKVSSTELQVMSPSHVCVLPVFHASLLQLPVSDCPE